MSLGKPEPLLPYFILWAVLMLLLGLSAVDYATRTGFPTQ